MLIIMAFTSYSHIYSVFILIGGKVEVHKQYKN